MQEWERIFDDLKSLGFEVGFWDREALFGEERPEGRAARDRKGTETQLPVSSA